MATFRYDELTGTIIPDTGEILGEVREEWRSVLGQQLAVAPNTPQGVAITSDTISRETTALNNAAVGNQLNPNLAGGIALDAIGALMDIERSLGTPSILRQVVLGGEPGTFIPLDTIVQDADGNQGSPLTTTTLNSLGAGAVDFQLLEVGPIAIAASQFTQIVDGPLGLETATNPTDAEVGSSVQTDNAFRSLRREALGNQALNSAGAIMAAIAQVNGFWSQSFQQNDDPTTETINGVSMAPNSIYSVVSGGTDLAVATVLDMKKGGGSQYNNGPGIHVSVPITNPYSGQVVDVLFDRPNLIPILVAVTVVMNVAVPDAVSVVKQAILAYAAGEVPGQEGFKVGLDVSAFELASAIYSQVPNLYVKTVFIALASDPPPTGSAPIPIAVYEMATVDASSIVVTVETS